MTSTIEAQPEARTGARTAARCDAPAEARTAATALTPAELDAVVRSHLPLVGHLVREMLGRLPAHVSREDLVSAGMAALAHAAKGFDPSRGIPFGSFATTRIRGALLDELRGLDWASRSVRTRARKVETTQQELTATLGRTPTQTELAEALGVAPDELRTIDDDVQRAVVLSLQGFAAGTAEDLVPERTPGPEDLILHRERIGYLHHAIGALPERLRQVITAYFFDERPMNDIARDLGVTESRVSQLRSEALILLRDGLNNHLDPHLVAAQERTGGCIARRREAYYNQIADQGNLSARLAHTTPLGIPYSA